MLAFCCVDESALTTSSQHTRRLASVTLAIKFRNYFNLKIYQLKIKVRILGESLKVEVFSRVSGGLSSLSTTDDNSRRAMINIRCRAHTPIDIVAFCGVVNSFIAFAAGA
jgi:hypothetical protein